MRNCIVTFAVGLSLVLDIGAFQTHEYEKMTFEMAISRFVITAQRTVLSRRPLSQRRISNNKLPCAFKCSASENCLFFFPELEQCMLFEYDSSETELLELSFVESQFVYAKSIGKLKPF